MIWRLVKGGMCTPKELSDHTYDWEDVFFMIRLLDLGDYIERQSYKIEQEKARKNGNR